MAAPFDVVPFWKRLDEFLVFVRDRLRFGQTDVERAKMSDHIINTYQTLRSLVIKDELQAQQTARLLFWDDCKRALDPVFDSQSRTARGSVGFEDLYSALHALQMVVFERPDPFWMSGPKPKAPKHAAQAPQARQRSRSRQRQEADRLQRWTCNGCRQTNAHKFFTCQSCRKPKVMKATDERMGSNGIWQWKNPPGKPLYEDEGFFVFVKPAYWLCETPDNVSELQRFEPLAKHSEGHFVMWIREKYASTYPFLNEYNKNTGLQYGLLNRLDRETSGPVIVCKNFEAFRTLKVLRDKHRWHKEYVCLVHGSVPVDAWSGVLDTPIELHKGKWQQTGKHGTQEKWVPTAWSKVAGGVPEPGVTVKQGISVYEVQGYFKINAAGKKFDSEHSSMTFTLVKVRIKTGLRHQIRVHMQHLMGKETAHKFKASQECLVSDFLYNRLGQPAIEFDKVQLCDRVFLHEQRLGLFDPATDERIIFVKAELPDDLQRCLQQKVVPDKERNAALKAHKEKLAAADPVAKFCLQRGLDASVKDKLASPCFAKHKGFREVLLQGLAARFDDASKLDDEGRLRGLHVDGDHSLLVSEILEDAEWKLWGLEKQAAEAMGRCNVAMFKIGLEEVLRRHIDGRILAQDRRRLEAEAAAQEERLPPGWRRLDASGMPSYVHDRGYRVERRPIADDALPEGWVKLATSQPNIFFYQHLATQRRQDTWPAKTDHLIPPGWVKTETVVQGVKTARYTHTATKRTQLGLPCPGPLEDLPSGWEKVASSKIGGQPYYFNRLTGVSQLTRPDEELLALAAGLPGGWAVRRSSAGQPYYWHQASNTSQVERPGASG